MCILRESCSTFAVADKIPIGFAPDKPRHGLLLRQPPSCVASSPSIPCDRPFGVLALRGENCPSFSRIVCIFCCWVLLRREAIYLVFCSAILSSFCCLRPACCCGSNFTCSSTSSASPLLLVPHELQLRGSVLFSSLLKTQTSISICSVWEIGVTTQDWHHIYTFLHSQECHVCPAPLCFCFSLYLSLTSSPSASPSVMRLWIFLIIWFFSGV